jgi:hypothetical protein
MLDDYSSLLLVVAVDMNREDTMAIKKANWSYLGILGVLCVD